MSTEHFRSTTEEKRRSEGLMETNIQEENHFPPLNWHITCWKQFGDIGIHCRECRWFLLRIQVHAGDHSGNNCNSQRNYILRIAIIFINRFYCLVPYHIFLCLKHMCSWPTYENRRHNKTSTSFNAKPSSINNCL